MAAGGTESPRGRTGEFGCLLSRRHELVFFSSLCVKSPKGEDPPSMKSPNATSEWGGALLGPHSAVADGTGDTV